MLFSTPNGERTFEIPDEWWIFAEMDRLRTLGRRSYVYRKDLHGISMVPISEIEPPTEGKMSPRLTKHRLVPILLAFATSEVVLPPVRARLTSTGPYRMTIVDGVHRYYASVAARFSLIPVMIQGNVAVVPAGA